MTQDNRSRVGGPRNVLYLTDQHDECDEAGCIELLGGDAPDEVDVLFVSFTETARERLATWRRHADAPPANVGIVSVETGGSSGEGAFGDGGPTVRRVSDPSDLTGVGIAISEFLSAWADDGKRTVVCFDSLTALLQYLEPRRVFQFCNEITSKFETAGATSHFHITPEAHDRQVLSVLASLFDDRVSAADLGYRRGERDRTDDGAPAGASPPVDGSESPEPPSPAASGQEPPSPDEPPTADGSEDSGFVFAGDEFGREATAESSEVQASDGDFFRGGTGDGGRDEDETADGGSGDEHASDERDDEHASDERDDAPSDAVEPAEAAGTAGPGEAADGAEPSEAAPGGEPAESTDGEAPVEGPEGTEPTREPEASGTPGRPTSGPRTADADPEVSASDALLPRTTATVVGVVVMLLLMSFFAAAFPAPLVLDDSGAADDTGADVATPEDAATGTDADAADGTTATLTATETEAATAPGTATATPTSDPTPAPTETDSDASSSDGSTGADVSTPTATTEPVSTETATATPTPTESDGSLIGDDDGLIGDDDDGLLGTGL